MKNQILQDLYHGRIIPDEVAFRRDSSYAKDLAEAASLADQIRDLLPNDQQILLDKLSDAQCRYSGKMEEEQFINGFRLGGQIILAVLNEGSTDITDMFESEMGIF